MTPRPSRRGLLALAALLLALSAWLLSVADGRPARAAHRAPSFPSRLREPEAERLERRRTLVVPGPPAPAGAVDAAGPRLRDPFLVALPAREGDPLVVLEANALRHSRLGELVVGCLLEKDPDTFAAIERETGIDPLKDVDRIAVAGDALVVSGFFDRARWQELERDGFRPAAYGDAGVVWEPAPRQAAKAPVIATWRDQLVVIGPDRETVARSVDQLEGRAPPPPVQIPEEMSYGEVYGIVPGDAARRLLRGDQDALGRRLAAAAQRIELHVDAMQDVAAVVRATGDAARLGDVGKALGAALAVGRVQAEATDDADLAHLLEFASVRPGDDGLSLELAVPAADLEAWFRDCAPLRRRRPGDGT